MNQLVAQGQLVGNPGTWKLLFRIMVIAPGAATEVLQLKTFMQAAITAAVMAGIIVAPAVSVSCWVHQTELNYDTTAYHLIVCAPGPAVAAAINVPTAAAAPPAAMLAYIPVAICSRRRCVRVGDGEGRADSGGLCRRSASWVGTASWPSPRKCTTPTPKSCTISCNFLQLDCARAYQIVPRQCTRVTAACV